MLEHAYAVIMAGGKGERFWPLSTARKPKQLLSLVGDRTLLGMAVDRLDGLIPPERVFVLTNAELVDASREAAPELPPENIFGEPIGRDTAAAVALGCAVVKAHDPEGVFCVLTADHIMGDLDLYRQTLRESLELAATEDVLMTIGITPAEASTGYGYIEAGAPVDHDGTLNFLKAERFVEKPDRETAQSYVNAGNYFWNSGMFIWSASTLHRALSTHRPQLAEMIDRLVPTVNTDAFEAALRKEFDALEKISIDYALMEHADNIVMAEGSFAWDDVGAWPALANHFEADDAGNVTIGDCEQVDAQGNIVFSKGHVTALLGVSDLVVVQAEGVTLVCPKDRAQDIKKLVEVLRGQDAYRDLV